MNIHITNLLIKLNYFVLFAWPCMAMFISLDTPTRAPRSKMTVLCFAVCESHSFDPQRMSRSGCPQSTKSEANESKASTVLRGAHPSITSCSVRTRTLTCAPISRFSRRRHHNVPLSMRSSRINRYVPTLHISRFVPPRQEKLNRATGRYCTNMHRVSSPPSCARCSTLTPAGRRMRRSRDIRGMLRCRRPCSRDTVPSVHTWTPCTSPWLARGISTR